MCDNTDSPLLNITVTGPLSIPPSMDAKQFQFFGDLRKTPLQNHPCYNCGSHNHQSKECEEPPRNEKFEDAAMRAKGLIRDEAKMVPEKARGEKENVSFKTESVIEVKEIKVKKVNHFSAEGIAELIWRTWTSSVHKRPLGRVIHHST